MYIPVYTCIAMLFFETSFAVLLCVFDLNECKKISENLTPDRGVS
jgi:hypothetical protein